MSFNIIETSVLSLYDSFLEFPKTSFEKLFADYCLDLRQQEEYYPIGSMGGKILYNYLLSGKAMPMQIYADLDQFKESSVVYSAYGEAAARYIISTQIALQTDYLVLKPKLLDRKLEAAKAFPKNISSMMTSSEKDLLADKAISVTEKIKNDLMDFKPNSTRTTLPGWLFQPGE